MELQNTLCQTENTSCNWKQLKKLSVEMANGSVASSNARGRTIIRLSNGNLLEITNVCYVPSLQMNLLSCSRLYLKGITVLFLDGRCTLKDR